MLRPRPCKRLQPRAAQPAAGGRRVRVARTRTHAPRRHPMARRLPARERGQTPRRHPVQGWSGQKPRSVLAVPSGGGGGGVPKATPALFWQRRGALWSVLVRAARVVDAGRGGSVRW